MSTASPRLAGEKARLRSEAALWRMRVAEEPERQSAPDFLEWVDQPGALEAFNAVEEAWDAFDQLAADPRMIVARRDALARARAASRPFDSWRRMAAGVLLTLAVAGGVGLWLPTRQTTYETGRGERRVVMLRDGSRLSLDSATKVTVRFTPGRRDLNLVGGQARFDVAHDRTRPFTVRAGDDLVTAVGTAFNVERLGPQVVVTLIEGKVRVEQDDDGPAAPPVTMTAGQRLITRPSKPAVVERVAVENVTAWEGGRLIFQNETLVEAVARVNRYAGRPIEVDPALASLRVSGAFNVGDTGAFVDAVTAYFPITATVGDEDQVILRPRG